MEMRIQDDEQVRILLIEDDTDDALLTQRAMQVYPNYVIEHVETLTEGLSRATNPQEEYALVLLDMGLPESSGIETLRVFMQQVSAVPVVVLTNAGDEAMGQQAIELGAQDYLVKHSRGGGIAQAVRYAIQRHRLSTKYKLEEMRAEFVRMISHELRTPMAILGAASNNLLSECIGPLNPAQHKAVSIIERTIQRLTRLTNNVLSLSYLESRENALQCDRLALKSFLGDCEESFTMMLRESDLRFVVERTPGVEDEMLYAHKDSLMQIMTNVVGNAQRFAAQQITVRVTKDGENALRVSVADDGPGMSAEDCGRIFDKFTKLESGAGHHSHKGAGLGLTICQKLVSYMGGRIWADATMGAGTTVHFTIPLCNYQEHGRDLFAKAVRDLSGHGGWQCLVIAHVQWSEAFAQHAISGALGGMLRDEDRVIYIPEDQSVVCLCEAPTTAAPEIAQRVAHWCETQRQELVPDSAETMWGCAAITRDDDYEVVYQHIREHLQSYRVRGAMQRSKRVLIIDDEPDICAVLEAQLQRLGFEVQSALSGPEGIRIADSVHPDAVVLDLNMPGMNGWEVAKQLKAQESTKDIPVYILTADASVRATHEGLAVPIDGFYSKSVDEDELFASLDACQQES